MKHIFKITVVAAVMATNAVFAGNVAPANVAEPLVVSEEPMGAGSSSWIVPLVAIGIIALVLSGDDEPRRAINDSPGPIIPGNDF